MSKMLTKKQLNVLKCFHNLTYKLAGSTFYISPSIREIANQLQLSSTTIYEHFKNMEKKNLLIAIDKKNRSRRFRLTKKGRETIGIFKTYLMYDCQVTKELDK